MNLSQQQHPPIPILNNFQSLLMNQGNHNNSEMSPPPSNVINRQIPISGPSPPSASSTPHEDPYTCDICHKSFAVPARLTRHYRTHTGEKPYTCEYCSKSFSVKENLSVHRRIHTKERPYICTVCSRAFEHSGKLHRHMRIHTGERPHKCNICNKTFIQSGQLVIHMRTHTGEKPYVCKTCGKGFTCSKQLKVHTRTHTGEKPYACEICGKSFGYNHVLKLHQVAHFGEKVYKCTICSTTFNSKKALENHIKTHNSSNGGGPTESNSTHHHENMELQSGKPKPIMITHKSPPVSLPQNQVSSDKENLHSSSSSTSSDDDILIPLHSGVSKARSLSITSSPTSSSRSMTPEDPEEADRLIIDLSDEDETTRHSHQKGPQRNNYYPPIFQNLPKHIFVHEEPNSAMTYLYVTTEEQRSVGQYPPSSQGNRTSNQPNSSAPFNLSSSVRIREDVVKELEKYGYGIGQSYHHGQGGHGQYHKVHSDDEESFNDPLAPMRKLLNNRSGLEIRPIQSNSRSSTDRDSDSLFPNSYSRDSYSSMSMATINNNNATTTPYKVLELALKKGSKAVQLELSNNSKRGSLFKDDLPLPTNSPRKRSRMILEKYLHDEEKGGAKEVNSCNNGNSSFNPTVRYSSVIQFANKK